ncbi:putative copper radical oxidase [Hygrophoropsis aurantiaca]|uniref:Copper radical oxidase n=1 Tax=Hygrophoropsis aurantiaca TaxID=72124 RepID=A0ACB8A6S7_9AGAM|nr:putative copper radical oxidase [Hygrophoropsis aurantiaca]
MFSHLSWLALGLAAELASAQQPGSIVQVGNTQVSAMMMLLGNEEKIYILDKTEGNAAQIDGHPAWGAVWDINTHTATPMEVLTNTFCASGMHLPNGSYATFGGNGAIGPGGAIGSVKNSAGSGAYDATYEDYDGTKSIRILNPCTSADDMSSPQCQWFDNATVLSMQKQRWYSAAEALGDGTIALIGGFVNGGYINRNTPNTDPEYEGGAAEPTYEFYPSRGPATVMQFMIQTSGLNSYAHTYLMPSGKMLIQANISTIIWDPDTNAETALPDMPGSVARVYPASGAVAMLPLTPANNYTPTVLFCGGSDMPDEYWGNYSYPNYNTWTYPASTDCQRITPEPADGSSPTYVQDDDMLEGRTMGQFIILPDGTLLVVNGGVNGTAGYAQATGQTATYAEMPFGESLASGPVGTPAIYNPNQPKGSRWSNAGLGSTNIARLYHSSAMLLPDASVMIAGSNPNIDVNTSTIYPTTYTAEIFYPPYFSASVRPQPSGIPTTLSYGGNSFDLTIPASSYTGSANAAAANTTVVLSRGGFTTHAMNMGQRHLQLNNTYTVNNDGSYVLHVSQAPPNPNILTPGPALMFVVINGIPSNGTMVIVGNGQVGTQPISAASELPVSASSSSNPGGSGKTGGTSGTTAHTGAIIGGVIGAIAVIGILGALFGIFVARRRRAASRQHPAAAYAMGATRSGFGGSAAASAMGMNVDRVRHSDSSAFVPLQQDNTSMAWNASSASLHSPYQDGFAEGRASEAEYDPYNVNAVGRSSSGQRL